MNLGSDFDWLEHHVDTAAEEQLAVNWRLSLLDWSADSS